MKKNWTTLAKKLESAFRKALFDFKMVEGVSKLAIALSGGKDSLTLLHLLKAVSGRGFPELDLYAIHVNGQFSCGAGFIFAKNVRRAKGSPHFLHLSPKAGDIAVL